jgi:hypothetical protein
MRRLALLGTVLTIPAWASTAPYAVVIDTTPAHVLNTFVPQQAIGVGVDGVPYPSVPEIYTAANVTKLLGAGLGAVSYRLYTELSVQDWHWNPAGTFSETATQGYWTSSPTLGAPTLNTFGYRLPRRGFTMDQGNNDDYSRLDDGDLTTFWKSNPYLSSAFTGTADSVHPQWVLYDLGSKKAVNAAQITWANPYAVSYLVQYWTGSDAIYSPGKGEWVTFPTGAITTGAGGTVTLALGTPPKNVEYIRILMSQSSGTCTFTGATDKRDCAGYAIAEAGFGSLSGTTFTDFVKHTPNQNQTLTYAASVDPWHSAANNVNDQEQPGFDTVFNSGLTRGLPTVVPIPMLYSTPANAAAEIAYLEARGDKIRMVEMGEEPDGQYVTPEDHAEIYGQFATAIHAVDPTLPLGGPVFESNETDVQAWPDAAGQISWTKRWVAYLTAHNHLADLNFFSFEHYPFGSCGNTHTQANLLKEPKLMADILAIWRADNLPAGLPIYVTETNYSQNETSAAQQPAGAIWYADMMGTLLSNGGSGGFLYEYEPYPLSASYPCGGFGTYGIMQGTQKFAAKYPLAQYFAARVLSSDWALSATAPHSLYPATVGGSDVTAYPLSRPDGSWAVLLVNRDLSNPHQITLSFTGPAGTHYLTGTVARTDFGAAQYNWVSDGAKSYPAPDGPEAQSTTTGGAGVVYTLPAAGITVMSGTVN